MKKIFLPILVLLFTTANSHAQAALRAKEFNLDKGLAIEGYDPVAYFNQHKAVKGKPAFTANVEGVTYNFISAANKELFVKEYKKYEPQYGGWCAYAMGSSNEKVSIDPETFKIINGKLYLFYHSWVNNTLNKWNENEATLKATADKNWTAIFR